MPHAGPIILDQKLAKLAHGPDAAYSLASRPSRQLRFDRSISVPRLQIFQLVYPASLPPARLLAMSDTKSYVPYCLCGPALLSTILAVARPIHANSASFAKLPFIDHRQ